MRIADARRSGLIASFAIALLLPVTAGIAADASAQSLPAGWKVTDVGSPPVPGSATLASPTLAVTSGGVDINGTKDQFTFAYASTRGDATIVARLSALPGADPWAQAGLMIRDSSGGRSAHLFVFATPGRGVMARYRLTRGGGTTQTASGTGAAPVWLKLERRANRFTASRSTNGTSWTTVRSVTIAMSSGTLIGFAVASHSATASAIAAFDSISVNGQSWASANLPPAVSLTTPTDGSSFSSPASVALAATATDVDGSIAKVDFYAGTTRLGTDTTSPFAFSWTGVAKGSYDVRAIATDNKGASTASATATITVGSNLAPTVSMTSPSDGASFVFPKLMTFTATAADSDGSIQRVEFYLGPLLVGTDTTSPYSIQWPAILGSHSVSAVAVDDLGARTVSAWRNFVVTSAALLSKAIFKPASPGDAVDYYRFEIFPAGADPVNAAPVASQNLGLPPVVSGECSADVGATILALSPGNYIATVAAVGSGSTLRSNTFAFTR